MLKSHEKWNTNKKNDFPIFPFFTELLSLLALFHLLHSLSEKID